MISKKFKKLFSIVLTTVFVLCSLSTSVLADLTQSKRGAAMPWHGDNNPLAAAVLSDGTSLTTDYESDSTYNTAPIITSMAGTYGKDETDTIYKTYDADSRTFISNERAGFVIDTRQSVSLVAGKDVVLSFSFAYDKAGGAVVSNKYSDGLLVKSYVRSQAYSSASRIDIYNPIAVRTDGIRIGDNSKNDLTGLKDDYFLNYKFNPNQWYNVDFVFDFENKAASTDENLQSEYKWSAYVNGVKLGEKTVTQSFYQFNNTWFTWSPAFGSEMYWDNLMVYNIDDAATFEPGIAPAELASSSSAVGVNKDMIKVESSNVTAGDVKAAVQSSLKEGETVRIYSADFSQELEDGASALGAKAVVAGSEALTATVTKENVYTYYDIVPDSYIFDEPTITVDSEAETVTGNVKLTNYTGDEQSFKVYLAVYDGHELVGISVASSDFVADADKTEAEFTTPALSFASGNVAKLFVWKADGITPELVSTSTN
ncbi:MAG: hypothetical protein IJB70_09050 [Clostridia bacterium]|nr:hypothetical protein [Clostridia bacterium]